MKKLPLFCILFICILLMACDNNPQEQSKHNGIAPEKIKVGFIYVGTANDKGYTYTHDQARLKMVKALGVETAIIENVVGDIRAEFAATKLIKQGCNIIYGTSYEYMEDLVIVAEKNPNVYFGHATGYMQLANLSNYMGRIYEARYLSGIIAGLNTKSNRIGYVAALPIGEVIRGINAFALGVKSVNKQALVEIQWTNSWENPVKEKEKAFVLIDRGADIITQHTNTQAPQIAAKERGILAIGYNSPTSKKSLPNTYITSPIFNWETFYIDDVKSIIDGTWKSRAYNEGLSANMVALDEINEALVTKDTIAKVEKVKKDIVENNFKIFTGPIFDNKRKLRLKEGKSMTPDEIQSITFFLDNVIDNN